MIDEFAKDYLHNDLRDVREVMLSKLDGLSEYDIRRPLTATGTNLLGLVKHLTHTEARYFGEVFDRPHPEPLARWDDEQVWRESMWPTEFETREDIVDRYRRAWAHSDATVEALRVDSPGHVRGGRARTSSCSPSWSTCSPKPAGMPDTPTSCANK